MKNIFKVFFKKLPRRSTKPRQQKVGLSEGEVGYGGFEGD